MNTKKNINKLKKVSTLLPQIIKNIKKKNNTNELVEIKMNWKEIIGENYFQKCYVSSLKKINSKKVLTIVADNYDVFELSYSSVLIKEKINSYFLRKVVDKIKFKKSLQT
tara:strand:+ start:807 stop:1136 length:330 start_codon:yes stop_codon:yes gene_type:complete